MGPQQLTELQKIVDSYDHYSVKMEYLRAFGYRAMLWLFFIVIFDLLLWVCVIMIDNISYKLEMQSDT